jgi:DNA-binding NarL/FixJ family response regulator
MADEWNRRVILVEDQPIVRVLVAESLRQAGFDVSAHGDARSALEAADRFDPDVLVADIDLGSRPDGVELALVLRARFPQLGVMFLTNYPRVASVPRKAVVTGAQFVSKDLLESPAQLSEWVDAAARADRLPVPDGPAGALAGLSRAQLSVLAELAAGCSNEEIARRTGRTLRAVERLVSRTFERMGVNDHPELNPRVVAVNLYTRAFGHPVADDRR